MAARISHTSIVVRDQDEAVAFYTSMLGFEQRDDYPMGSGTRWVTVALPNDSVELILEHPSWHAEHPERMAEIEAMIGKQGVVLHVDDCKVLAEAFKGRGVVFVSEPDDVVGDTGSCQRSLWQYGGDGTANTVASLFSQPAPHARIGSSRAACPTEHAAVRWVK